MRVSTQLEIISMLGGERLFESYWRHEYFSFFIPCLPYNKSFRYPPSRESDSFQIIFDSENIECFMFERITILLNRLRIRWPSGCTDLNTWIIICQNLRSSTDRCVKCGSLPRQCVSVSFVNYRVHAVGTELFYNVEKSRRVYPPIGTLLYTETSSNETISWLTSKQKHNEKRAARAR
jgi:hypothetical protein